MSRLRPEQFAELGHQRLQDHRRRPHRKGRLFRYVIVLANIGFLLWAMTTLTVGFADNPTGATIGVVLIIGFWAIVDIILGVIYLALRDRR